MLQPNPLSWICVLFVFLFEKNRDPVARAWSDYRFLWGYFAAPEGLSFQAGENRLRVMHTHENNSGGCPL